MYVQHINGLVVLHTLLVLACYDSYVRCGLSRHYRKKNLDTVTTTSFSMQIWSRGLPKVDLSNSSTTERCCLASKEWAQNGDRYEQQTK